MRKFRITIEDETYEVVVEELKEARKVSLARTAASTAPAASSTRVETPARGRASAPAIAAGAVYAPSPCTVVSIKVTPGCKVEAGETLLITESMKMQTSINAKATGTVKEIHVKEGQFVKRGEPLITIE